MRTCFPQVPGAQIFFRTALPRYPLVPRKSATSDGGQFFLENFRTYDTPLGTPTTSRRIIGHGPAVARFKRARYTTPAGSRPEYAPGTAPRRPACPRTTGRGCARAGVCGIWCRMVGKSEKMCTKTRRFCGSDPGALAVGGRVRLHARVQNSRRSSRFAQGNRGFSVGAGRVVFFQRFCAR